MAEVFDFGLQQHKIKMDGKFFENNLFAVAGDTGRRLEVQLLDSNNMIQNTTGISLRLNANVAGQATYAEATLVDATKGLYELDLPNGMLIAPGNWQFQWQIIGASGEKLHSFAFTGSVGSNLSEGGSEATNFYLNADELKQMQDDLINGTFNSEVLETNIAEKLTDLETQYAPKLTEVTTQLTQTIVKVNDTAVSIRDYPRLALEVTDTERIQRAIDNNSRIFLPDALYEVSKIVMKTNTHLIGQSIKGVTIKGISTEVNAVIYSDLSANNYSIENLIVDAPTGVTGILLDNLGVLSTQDLHPEIRNVIILNGLYGLRIMGGVRGGLFENVRPGASGASGIAMESTDCIFVNCVVAMARYDGFKVVNGNNTFIGCKAFCCGESKSYGAGFKLQGSFNRLINCEFQQNRFENLYLQNANNNIIQGVVLDSAGWGAPTHFPLLTYADNGTGSQVPISGLRTYNSNNNIIDVAVINGRLNGASKCALYGQYAASTNKNDIRMTTFDNLVDGVFTEYISDYPNAYFKQNKVVINSVEKINKAYTAPTIVSGNVVIDAGGYIEKDGVVFVDVKVTVQNTIAYVGELLSGLPAPIVDSAMQVYFASYKYCAVNTAGKLVVGATITAGDVYRICGSYIKA